MTDLFIDKDVIIDYITDRKPFADTAEKLFALIENKKLKGHTSSLCFSNLYYLLRQQLSRSKSISLLKDLAGMLNILKVDEDSILQALDSDFKDFEDAIQYFTASDYKRIDVIITRNIKDYKHSSLPVMTPDTMLKTYVQALK
ncbi:MAG: PIN domain-containing protein [Bacteroidales bacterium]|nr:PIN domain-containing protein [Bacteroidales bacterium]